MTARRPAMADSIGSRFSVMSRSALDARRHRPGAARDAARRQYTTVSDAAVRWARRSWLTTTLWNGAPHRRGRLFRVPVDSRRRRDVALKPLFDVRTAVPDVAPNLDGGRTGTEVAPL